MENNTFVNGILKSAFSSLSVNNDDRREEVAELLEKFGLRWDVQKKPLHLVTGENTGFYGIVREDTNKTFAAVKKSYQPYQNSELAELVLRLSDRTGYKIHTGGMFDDGGKVFLQLSSANELQGIGANNSTVKSYYTGINSHDGSCSLKWGIANFTVCCKNSFALASKSLKNSARHTSTIKIKIEEALREIDALQKAEQNLFEKYIKLAETPVTRTSIAKIVNTVTDVDILKSTSEQKDISSYAKNRAEELLRSITKEMTAKGETLWGVFSGVTHYTTHIMPIASKKANARLASKHIGNAFKLDNEALVELVAMC
ncbi:phage/plasmid-like protein (TIGR03299 family) [Chitinophaga skermanii]|uniref:Phage/plasmid-like protein (TIGR03299 family) n=1 Tax=Chitinophaga skermanii TaxID=331697 RepID=A0A327PY55_9BACT|nr:DUF932 domain-containing protein [Chitinophaga skermanii]RAI96969.1 phage/plasmid-like protein (TIGR03299 family) [Chitinophaga skermanii]